jgi:hypothetical protein
MGAKLEELTSQGVATVKSPSISGSWQGGLAAYHYLYPSSGREKPHRPRSPQRPVASALARLAGAPPNLQHSQRRTSIRNSKAPAVQMSEWWNRPLHSHLGSGEDYFLSVSGASREK